ncbi:prolyl oligopeptidase family serine peptidase [Glaciecola sp. 1036]|uniref:S9 family peptidase n=1 Tax=Alteromonadaceae TaxID=72275 RepID=UPI003D019B38
MNTKILALLLCSSLLLTACQPKNEAEQTENPPADTANQEIKPIVKEVPQYSVEDFFETTTLLGSRIDAKGEYILVSSDASGVFNAFKYPVNGGDPIALTNSTEDSVWVVDWLNGENRFLYVSDKGGDELDHVYVQESDGSVVDLTPGDNLKASFLAFNDDKSQVYILTNERDNNLFDLYRYSTEDYSRTLIYENTENLSLDIISQDGRYLAASKSISNQKTDLYLIDLVNDDKKPKLITDAEAQVEHSALTFIPGKHKLVYAGNEDSEFYQAYTYDIVTNNTELTYPTDWDITYYYYSPQGRYIVVNTNEDAKIKVTIIDTKTRQPVDLPELPVGSIQNVNFNQDETAIAFLLNADSTPSNLYYHKLGSSSAKKLSKTLNPKMSSDELVESTVERFESFDGLSVPGLLYRPHAASADNKVPAIVLVHGGPGGQARKDYNPTIQHLVNNGYAIFDVNNRGSSGYGKTFYHLDDKKHGEDDLQDIVYAKKYLQSLDWVEQDKIAIMGGSYGGYMVMAAMAFTNEFKLGINIFGVTNWVRTLESIPPWWGSFRQALYDELGDPATDKERLTRISPLFHADKIQSPVLIVQGANDPRVLQIESDEMVENMRANEVPVEYVLFDDEGHGFTKKENRIAAQKAYINFLRKYL